MIGKAGTITIEQENSHTRHHRGRMTRRTTGVSTQEEMVYAAIKRWGALTQPITVAAFQQAALSIFR